MDNPQHLLTLRILEASERKMKLIKELLSPQEYESLSAELFTMTPPADQLTQFKAEEPHQFRRKSGTRSHTVFHSLEDDTTQQLTTRSRRDTTSLRNRCQIQESLSRKRRAIDFFFTSDPTDTPKQSTTPHTNSLAIELRFGHYLPAPEQQHQDSLLTSYGQHLGQGLIGYLISLVARFVTLVQQLISNNNSHHDDDQEAVDPSDRIELSQFSELHRVRNCLPYSSASNLKLARARLKADGGNQCDKLMSGARQETPRPKQSPRTSVQWAPGLSSQLTPTPNIRFNLDLKLPFPVEPRDTLADVLVYHQLVERLLARPPLINNREPINLLISSFKLINHEFISREQREADELVVLHSKYLQLVNKVTRLTATLRVFKQQLSSNQALRGKPENTETFTRLTILQTRMSDELIRRSQELDKRWTQLVALREQQSFSVTGVKLNTKSGQLIDLNYVTNERAIKMVDKIELHLEGNARTPESELPAAELERRANLDRWLKSARLHLSSSSSSSSHTCKLEELTSTTSGREFTLSVPTGEKHCVTIRCDLLARRPISETSGYSLAHRLKLSPLIVEATGELTLRNTHERVCTHLDLRRDNKTSARLELQIIRATTSDRKLQSITWIDRVHGCFFRRSKFLDRHTKLAQLMNRVNLGALTQLTDRKSPRTGYCIVDPFVPSIVGSMGEATSLRSALLAWRWATNLPETTERQQVYLSERENAVQVSGSGSGSGVSLQEFRSRLSERQVELNSSQIGYKLIEMRHSQAVEFIRQCELLIQEALRNRQQASGSHEPTGTTSGGAANELLIEPQIKVNLRLGGVARTMRLLVPRRTARRPLRSDRRHRKHVHDTKLGQLVEMSLEVGAGEPEVDLERGAFDRWRGFGAAAQATQVPRPHERQQLRLLVTIQQAHNVPMRIVAPPQLTRSNSPYPPQPFRSPSPRLTNTPLGTTGSVVVGGAYLAPPTTYVEAIFQRKQLTSSLAQGKSPAWNETLFFPVDLGVSLATSHLADEWLQLNLYDCQCYVTEHQAPPAIISDEPYYTGGSGTSGSRLFASQRQRVERHLVGSLRIPMATLLSSNGRLEGSFPLSQPLLLDNYQFDSPPTQPPPMLHNFLSTDAHSNISLFITLDPPVSLPVHAHLPLATCEPEQVFVYARLWEQVMLDARPAAGRANQRQRRRQQLPVELNVSQLGSSQHTPVVHQPRHVRALVLTHEGQYQLVTRCLLPVRPPQVSAGNYHNSSDDAVNEYMRFLARFVSLLSPLKYGHFRLRALAPNLWFSWQQLLEKSLGGPEEKAILLCNYFLYLGKCAALLLGDTALSGRCVYVIVWSGNFKGGRPAEDNTGDEGGPQQVTVDQTNFINNLPILISLKSIRIWDPNAGSCHRLADPTLGLISVGSIVSLENVYANIQACDRPTEVNYDIRQKNLWFPLLQTGSSTTTGTNKEDNSLLKQTTIARKMTGWNWRRQLGYLDNLARLIGRAPASSLRGALARPSYQCFSTDQCHELRLAIEHSIKTHLLTWRPDRPTYFNRTLSRLLADKLASIEANHFRLRQVNKGPPGETPEDAEVSALGQVRADWRAELAELIRSEVLSVAVSSQQLLIGGGGLHERQVISWPINLSYTGMKSILDGLYASGVHNADLILDNADELADEPQVNLSPTQAPINLSSQFLVACHVEPYPAHVMSVWLYVGVVLTGSGGGGVATKSSGVLI